MGFWKELWERQVKHFKILLYLMPVFLIITIIVLYPVIFNTQVKYHEEQKRQTTNELVKDLTGQDLGKVLNLTTTGEALVKLGQIEEDKINFGFLGDINGLYGFGFDSDLPLDYNSSLEICKDIGFKTGEYEKMQSCGFNKHCYKCIGIKEDGKS